MRTRDLKPGFFRDLELSELPHVTRLLFAGLWCFADRRGRCPDNHKLIKADVFPYENVPVEKHLKLLADHDFIRRYEADGKKCIWIPRFKAHQKPHPAELESVLPPHPEDPEGDTSGSTKVIIGGAPRSSSEEDQGAPPVTTSNHSLQQSSDLSLLGSLSPLGTPAIADVAAQERVEGLLEEWAEQIGTLPAKHADDFQRLALAAPDGWFVQAIERTKHEAKRAPWPYCAKVLQGCIDENIPPNGFSESSDDNSARSQMLRRYAGAR